MSQKVVYCLVIVLCIVRAMTQKLDAQGGYGGEVWDDGILDGVKKVYVGDGSYGCVGFVKFDYVNGSKIETREHGKQLQEPNEFVLDYPKEYITIVEGTYNRIEAYASDIVTSLTFKTSQQRSSPTFGTPVGTKFVLELNGAKLVGFHGRAGDALDAIGAYFAWTSPVTKVEAQGGPGGEPWVDGFYNNVRKVYVGKGIYPCVGYVKFEYDNDGKLETRDHGKKVEEPQEFSLDHPHEHITSVEGTYGWIEAYANNIVTSLTFKTSKKRTSPTFGNTTGTTFVLDVEDKRHKIVGFHGRSGDALDAIGAYFSPITKKPTLG